MTNKKYSIADMPDHDNIVADYILYLCMNDTSSFTLCFGR